MILLPDIIRKAVDEGHIVGMLYTDKKKLKKNNFMAPFYGWVQLPQG